MEQFPCMFKWLRKAGKPLSLLIIPGGHGHGFPGYWLD
jgi:hypothetical protein